MGASRLTVCVALLGLLPAGIVRAQTPQEKKRGDILKDLGLKKKPPAPPPEATPAPPAGEPPTEGGEKADRPRRAPPPASRRARARPFHPPGPAAPSFARVVHPLFVATCKACHAPGAPGGVSRLLLSGDAATDHHTVVRFVNTRDPEASVLLGKVSGATLHAGGAPWPAAGAQYQRVLAWIRGGARLDAAAKAEPVAEATAAAPRVPPVAAPTGGVPRPRLTAGGARGGPAGRRRARSGHTDRLRAPPRPRRQRSPRRPPDRARRASRRRSIPC
jgi:hypothetical protein